jgi:hypothetical protein
MSLTLGSRGAGKSFLSAIDTHLRSRFYPRHGTRVLGGSKAQSEQIYRALQEAVIGGQGCLGSDRDSILRLTKTLASYRNGSEVGILAASSTSVRGPHVPSLKLDEVDEIDPELRDAALGQSMERRGRPAHVIMTSTWHRVGGPMAELLAQGKRGLFPVWRFCAFEVLERCPEERSGPQLERCPECPLQKWCHEDFAAGLADRPKAKISEGHYKIDALVQKVKGVSLRVFEADYLCRGPKADGLWFKEFTEATAVSERAEYHHAFPVHVAIDSGVFTGAVAFQIRPGPDGFPTVNVFVDYLAENAPARRNAQLIVAALGGRRGTRLKVTADPAGGARNAIGPTVLAEYHAEGLRAEPWPGGSVADSLATVEALLSPAAGSPRLLIHPRCTSTITALQHYRRAKRGGQWQDYPEDPQHPHEDLVDALRGGLRAEFPEGLNRPADSYRRIHHTRITH